MSYTLIIDTAIFGAGIAIYGEESKSIEFCEISLDVTDSARQLPLMVEKALSSLAIQSSAISRIVVSRGPGSFTGIRVGMGYAFGYLSGLRCSTQNSPRLTGFSSLEFFAEACASELGKKLMIFLPSTKSTGYAVTFDQRETNVFALDCSKVDSEALFQKNKKLHWVVIGAWDFVSEWANKNQVGDFRVVTGRDAVKLALNAAGEALRSGRNFDWVNFESGNLPQPAYMRKSTVEEKTTANV